jgi:nucleoside-diphosphate-sugar epimerase
MTIKDKRVLVTGGSGFIPSHLVRALVNIGAEVAVTTKYNSIVDNVRLVDVWDSLHVIEADIRNADALKQISVFKPQIIFHMAAYNHVGDSFTNCSEALDSNSKGTANIFQAYDDYERFIYISSSEVYGFQESVPFVETMTPNPVSPYSIGKYSGELFAHMMMRDLSKPVVILRPFNTFGPYQSAKAVIPEIIINCLKGKPINSTEGIQTREFNFVSNIVDALLISAENEKATGQVMNIGAGEEVAIKDLIKNIHDITSSSSDLNIGSIPYRPSEIWRMKADSKLSNEILGWEPKIKLSDGLKLTVEWFKKYLAVYHGETGSLSELASFN